MADKKISALTAATTPLAGTEVLPIVQSGATVKVAISDVTAGRAVTMLSNTMVSASAVNDVDKTGGGSYGYRIKGNDQSNVRYRFENTNGQIYELVGGNPGASNSGWAIFDATAGATRLYLDSSGNFLFGTTNNASSARIMCNGTFAIQSDGNGNRAVLAILVSNENFNGAGTAIYVGRDGATNRSINAGGTINALGTDYAEYMTKAGNFTVAKGDVVGIDAQGKLTNVFADAVSFVVKSTDPSFVGGDTWGNEEALGLKRPDAPVRVLDETEQRLVSEATEDQEAVYETIVTKAGDSDEEWAAKEAAYLAEKAVFDAALESARAVVDRVAFAGQVPVNVLGATAGQYIVPVDDNGSIKGQAVSNPTFEQYQSAVGKVIAIEADGRARIIVKVA